MLQKTINGMCSWCVIASRRVKVAGQLTSVSGIMLIAGACDCEMCSIILDKAWQGISSPQPTDMLLQAASPSWGVCHVMPGGQRQ